MRFQSAFLSWLLANFEQALFWTCAIEAMKTDFEKSIFQEWKNDLASKYPAFEQVTKEAAGVIIPVKDTSVRAVASIDGNQLFCEVYTDHLRKDEIVPPEVVERIKHLLPKEKDNKSYWVWTPRHSYEETYRLLCEVIELIVGVK